MLLLLALLPLGINQANAATVTATGTNPAICNQTVSDNTNVVAYRLSGGDCVVEFRNVGSVTWTSPAALQPMQVLVVAGGGGGAARHSGGGGGGGIIYLTNYKALTNTAYPIVVGDGGAGAPGLSTSGGGRAGNNSSFAGTSGIGSVVANGGGGGGGGNDAANALDNGGATNGSPIRGSGGGSNYEGNAAGTASPGTTSDYVRSAGNSTASINGVTASIVAYGQAGAVGKANSCYGPSNSNTGWCGGGGGGSSAAGTSPSQPGAVNPWKAGKGGDGASISITGTATVYAGGGGGGSGTDVLNQASNATCVANSPLAGDGGSGGGGAGAQCLNTATSGTSNTGGGGGGAGLGYVTGNSNSQGVGGKGGSGIVVLRYTPDTTTSIGSLTTSATVNKGITASLSVTVNNAGKVRFFVDGKRIANCLAVATTGSYPNYTATCNWKPTVTSRHILTATFTPTDASYASASPPATTLFILRRTTTR